MRFGVVLLCAGRLSRAGRPGALTPYLGRTLIEHSARVALASGAAEVVVVLGADAEALRPRLARLGVRIVTNAAWAEGMAGSIRAGVATLPPDLDGAVVALGDQPRITPRHLRALAEGLGDAPIVASRYDGVIGAPAAFRRSEFDRLLALKGEEGARAILRAAPELVATIEFAGANVEAERPEGRTIIVPPAPGRMPRRSARAHGSRAPPVAVLVSLRGSLALV